MSYILDCTFPSTGSQTLNAFFAPFNLTGRNMGGGVFMPNGTGGYTLSGQQASLSQSGSTLKFPWIGTVATGGDQSYGQASTSGFTAYSTAAPGTAAYRITQKLGNYDLILALGGSYESWGLSSSGRTKADLVTTIKHGGTYPNTINNSRVLYVFLYSIMESAQNLTSGGAYQGWFSQIINNNWWLYATTNHTPGSGTMVQSPASGSGFYNVNYAYAWDTAAGTVPVGYTICGNAYGTMSGPNQGPARTAAQYFVTALLTTNRTLDSRFSSLPVNGAAPNADGIHFDNTYCFPGAGGNVSIAQSSWDGQNLQNNNTPSKYPTGASTLMAYGQKQFWATMQAYSQSCNPGSSYINCGNFGSYTNVSQYGNTHTL